MISDVWNDCPVCGKSLKLWKHLTEDFYRIWCDEKNSHYGVSVYKDTNEIMLEFYWINKFHIVRRANSFMINDHISKYKTDLDYQLPFDKINSEKKIKKLMVLL